MDADTLSVSQRLIAHIATVSGGDAASLSPETSLFDLGMDSMLLAIILRDVEVEFDIEFGDDEVATFLAASSIRDYVGIVENALLRRRPDRVEAAQPA